MSTFRYWLFNFASRRALNSPGRPVERWQILKFRASSTAQERAGERFGASKFVAWSCNWINAPNDILHAGADWNGDMSERELNGISCSLSGQA